MVLCSVTALSSAAVGAPVDTLTKCCCRGPTWSALHQTVGRAFLSRTCRETQGRVLPDPLCSTFVPALDNSANSCICGLVCGVPGLHRHGRPLCRFLAR